MKKLKEVKELVSKLELVLGELKEEAKQHVSTKSIAQDCLRAGFQSTCASGIANLFKIDKTTVEACKDFYPRHLEEVKKVSESQKNKWIRECSHVYSSYKEWKFRKLRFWQLHEMYKLSKEQLPLISLSEIKVDEPKVDIPGGFIRTNISIEVSFPEIYKGYFGYCEQDENNKTLWKKKFSDHIDTKAKRGTVVYEDYKRYNKSYIPEEAVSVVREALEIGLTNIQVCYPSISDGKIPDKDPIIVGYLNYVSEDGSHEKSDMYILAWFGYDKKNPMTCNI